MTERNQPGHTEARGKRDDGGERLGRETAAPGVFRQHVSRQGFGRVVKAKPGAAEQTAVGARHDHVGPGGPAVPFRFAEQDEGCAILHRTMTRPAEIAGDVGIAGVAFENRNGVSDGRPSEDQP